MGVLSLLFFLNSCDSRTSSDYNSLDNDPATIATGKISFSKNCSGCHAFGRDGIGPKLAGITNQVAKDWIRQFIKNPQQLISSGDKHSQKLFAEYKVVMPSFSSLEDDELSAIIAFLHSHKTSTQQLAKDSSVGLSNPIPDPIKLSSLVVNLKLLAQFPATDSIAPLARITKLTFLPKKNDLFVNDLRGKLYKLQNEKPVVYLDIAKQRPKFIDQPGVATGLGSFAFHPDFAHNGLLYTTHAEVPGLIKADFDYGDSIEVTVQWVLTEWKADNPNADTFSGTSRELFRVNMVTGMHGLQEITFNPMSKPGDEDYGLLYIGVGDGASVENDYAFLVQSTEKIWGTILRIDPQGKNSTNKQYGIPKTNPFFKNQNSKTLKEIYAYGFRNPHRITWTESGKMLVCNIGQANIESINLIEPGGNYGWPFREGTFVLDLKTDLKKVNPLPANDSVYKFIYPVAQYDHDEGFAITGGFQYLGKTIPQLKGKFLFGDIRLGRLFYIDVADIKQGSQAIIKEWKISLDGVTTTLKNLYGNNSVELRFGRDAKGEIYIMSKTDGKVYKLKDAKMED
ncbi:MAG: PQQ-dependent sugar dehydrogenase [Bacteroidetes bacterium]|nr:PQQ-dependent sugar dehydrogenase [Bacteroidota bacterium]